jgi:asparagine synthase (glutamine-hydrolysing)
VPSALVAYSRRDYEAAGIVWNERQDIGLIFVGESFDANPRAKTIRVRGEAPRSDAEQFLRIYEEIGQRFLAEINGRFSGVLIDRRTQVILLFNDRFGLNRVYVHESPDGIHFASEAKSLLAALPRTRRIEQRCLAEFFAVGCVLQNRSLFNAITLLPPASLWTFQRDGSIRRETYFDIRTWEQQEPLPPDEYDDHLVDVFSRVAPKYLRSDSEVGMSLTGGLDSRMILAWIHAASGSLPCYTFGGPYRDCADVKIARELARVCEQQHTTLRVQSDFFPRFHELAERTVYATDGTMDVSGAIELYMNRHARQIAPIRLTGNYGSEVLRSNVAFRPASLDRSLFTPEFSSLIDQAAETYRSEFSCRRLTFITQKQVPWHHFGRFAAERSELTPRSPFLDNELVALAYRAPRNSETSPVPLLRLISRGKPLLDIVRTDRALQTRSLPVLGKLNREWQEFTAKAEYAYDYGMPGWLARVDSALRPLHLERLFLGRHKFYHYRVWYRDQLSSALRDGGFTRALPCYAEGAPQRLINEHTSGKINRTLELHKLLTVQFVDRLFGDAPCRN